MTTHKILLTIVLAVSAFQLRAADDSPAYNFLNIPSSAHVYGLGGVNISIIDDDINLIDQNPALLGPEIDMQAGLNYMHYVGGSNFAGLKFGMAATERSAWAFGLQYFGYGEIRQTEIDGSVSGTFSPKDVTFSGYYSHDITDRLRGGIALKGVYSGYEAYTAWAIATDLGLNFYNPDRDLSLSLVVANLGGQVKRFNAAYDRLPIDVRLGWTQSFGSFRFSATAWNLTKWKLPYYDPGDGTTDAKPELKENFGSNLFRHLVFGVEFVPTDRIYVGIGYNYKTRTDMSTYSRNFLSGFSIAAGLKVKMFGFGVAFAQPHTGATTFMLNLTTNLYEFSRK
ncbi:MAG: type IX secretion system protein PorQ [Pseudoflavonifractor sp.]|nr:type IX secretion system protein PorQ [Pseudoflavonifractor sp.]